MTLIARPIAWTVVSRRTAEIYAAASDDVADAIAEAVAR